MKLKLFFGAFMLVCMPFWCSAQEKTKVKPSGKIKTKENSNSGASPSWGAAHQYHNDRSVYFPDYYTFYEPNRGYIYWNNDNWATSSTVPPFMSSADLNKARVQLIEGDASGHPENQYNNYKNMYPARKIEVVVPVPDVK
jgi:hypothetical protein